MGPLKRSFASSYSVKKFDFHKKKKKRKKNTTGSRLTCFYIKAGEVELAHVELYTDDGKHNNSKEEQQSNLKKGNHGLHNGL